MNILFLAPQPFYENRGTPIAVGLVLKALSDRGERVDFVTYHLGEERVYPLVTIHRIPKIPFIREMRPGFSWKKVICDIFVFAKAFYLTLRNHYDLVHAVEESVFMAMILKFLFQIPYVYDMDSSMVEQITRKHHFGFLRNMLSKFEALAAKHAVLVIAVCDSLGDLAQKYGAKNVALLPDISLIHGAQNGRVILRNELGIEGALLLYVGNLEPYQGIDLLIESFHLAVKGGAQAELVIVGGINQDIAFYQEKVKALGLERNIHFTGPKSLNELGSLLSQADILVSPRVGGRNTAMKIYSYLHSGKPILATRLLSHTQVLSHENSLLCNPEPLDFANGMKQLIADPHLRRQLGEKGKELAEERYTYRTFEARFKTLYDSLAVRN